MGEWKERPKQRNEKNLIDRRRRRAASISLLNSEGQLLGRDSGASDFFIAGATV